MRLFSILLLLFSITLANAQSIENVQATFAEGQVIITYDLKADVNQEFTVGIYGSHNGYSTPLKLVTGDVGLIKPGTGKRAVWDAKTELVTYRGEISFRVRGTPNIAPLVFSKPTAGGSVRRGKAASIQWKGGTPGQNVSLELYQGSQRIETLGQIDNTGTFTWQVPANFQKGRYTLKLSASNQTAQADFSVKAKVPMLLKVLPIAIVGGLAAALGGGGGTTKTESDLPGAPGTPN